MSRRHSQIEKEGEQFVIADLESLNGTFINDVPVKRRPLHHGDRVRIGESQFLFLMHDGDVSSKSSEVKFDDRQIVSGSTIQVRFNDALYLMARDLSALMKVSTTINAIRGVEELQKALLELLFEVVPAQRGAILLSAATADENEEEFASVFGLDRLRGPDAAVRVSRTIAHRVLKDRASLLIDGADLRRERDWQGTWRRERSIRTANAPIGLSWPLTVPRSRNRCWRVSYLDMRKATLQGRSLLKMGV